MHKMAPPYPVVWDHTQEVCFATRHSRCILRSGTRVIFQTVCLQKLTWIQASSGTVATMEISSLKTRLKVRCTCQFSFERLAPETETELEPHWFIAIKAAVTVAGTASVVGADNRWLQLACRINGRRGAPR